jgi:Predicted DNA modification methylase
VLDPMMGSGTVLAIAQSFGHHAVGFDLDPLAVLASRVWTTPVDGKCARGRAEEVLKRAKAVYANLSIGESYPPSADVETKKFVRYWFDEHARRQLAALARVIASSRDDRLRDVLWCAFSRLIITKQAGASLAMDLSHSRPHKVFRRAPRRPFKTFLSAIEVVASNCPASGDATSNVRTAPLIGDARNLPMSDATVDVVVTSPPYLNAIDYMRCSKFSLVWMDYQIKDLRSIRRKSIGAEVSLAPDNTFHEVNEMVDRLRLKPEMRARDKAVLRKYAYDMQKAIGEVARVLVPGGKAVYVVGNSTVRGTFVCNSALVEASALAHGLRLVRKSVRLLPASRRYLPPPCRSNAGTLGCRMRQEVVLTFECPKKTER